MNEDFRNENQVFIFSISFEVIYDNCIVIVCNFRIDIGNRNLVFIFEVFIYLSNVDLMISEKDQSLF